MPKCQQCRNGTTYNRTKTRCKLGLVSEGKRFPVTRAKAEVECEKFHHYKDRRE